MSDEASYGISLLRSYGISLLTHMHGTHWQRTATIDTAAHLRSDWHQNGGSACSSTRAGHYMHTHAAHTASIKDAIKREAKRRLDCLSHAHI
jgi:hypothetical protein